MHHQVAQPGRPWGPEKSRAMLTLMMLAPGVSHHEHQVVRLGVAEYIPETTATRHVYETLVGPKGAADAGASEIVRKTQIRSVNTAGNVL